MADDLNDKVERLLNRIGEAFEELLTLRIETAVVPMEVEKPANGEWRLAPKPGDAVDGIVTTIRLDQGDIRNALSEGSLQNQKLMEIHTQQVTVSREIVTDNLKAVVELARSLVK